jgi:hypothetical protein
MMVVEEGHVFAPLWSDVASLLHVIGGGGGAHSARPPAQTLNIFTSTDAARDSGVAKETVLSQFRMDGKDCAVFVYAGFSYTFNSLSKHGANVNCSGGNLNVSATQVGPDAARIIADLRWISRYLICLYHNQCSSATGSCSSI